MKSKKKLNSTVIFSFDRRHAIFIHRPQSRKHPSKEGPCQIHCHLALRQIPNPPPPLIHQTKLRPPPPPRQQQPPPQKVQPHHQFRSLSHGLPILPSPSTGSKTSFLPLIGLPKTSLHLNFLQSSLFLSLTLQSSPPRKFFTKRLIVSGLMTVMIIQELQLQEMFMGNFMMSFFCCKMLGFLVKIVFLCLMEIMLIEERGVLRLSCSCQLGR